MNPKELWNSYNDIEKKGLYAPDVTHAAIITETGIIYPQYLENVNNYSKLANDFNFAISLIEKNI